MRFSDDTYTNNYLQSVHRQAARETMRRERLARKWQMPGHNPLSIYCIDPTRLAVLNFNEGMRERRREMQTELISLRRRVDKWKSQLAAGGRMSGPADAC